MPKFKKLTPELEKERNQKITQMYLSGISTWELGKEFNLSQTYLYKILNKCKCFERPYIKSKWSERDEEIVKLYNENLTIKEIANKYGLQTRSIIAVLNKRGFNVCTIEKKKLKNRNEEIVKYYNDNTDITLKNLGKIFDLSKRQVRIILGENYNTKTKEDRDNEITEKVIELYSSGLTQKEIGVKLSIATGIVRRILKKNSISKNYFRDDLTGQRFGRWTVLKEVETIISGKKVQKIIHRWFCQCDCGKTAIVREVNLKSGHSNSCGCLQREKQSKLFTTHGLTVNGERTLEYTMFCSSKSRAIKKNLPFDLELSDIVIPEYCPVFPEIKLVKNINQHKDNSPSLDRIIPELGYISGNVRVISSKANTIKSKFYDPDDFLQVAIWLEKELKLQKRKHLKVVGVK
jgi:Mor family transcriptional regulator